MRPRSFLSFQGNLEQHVQVEFLAFIVEAEAELCAAVVNALEVKPPERPIEKKKELTKEDTLKKAIQALRKAVLASPSDVQLRNNLAGALTRIGGVGELEEACRHATHATRLKPDDAWGH